MYEGTIVTVTFKDLIKNCSNMGIRYCEDSNCEVEPFCKLSNERKVCSPDICPLICHNENKEQKNGVREFAEWIHQYLGNSNNVLYTFRQSPVGFTFVDKKTVDEILTEYEGSKK